MSVRIRDYKAQAIAVLRAALADNDTAIKILEEGVRRSYSINQIIFGFPEHSGYRGIQDHLTLPVMKYLFDLMCATTTDDFARRKRKRRGEKIQAREVANYVGAKMRVASPEARAVLAVAEDMIATGSYELKDLHKCQLAAKLGPLRDPVRIAPMEMHERVLARDDWRCLRCGATDGLHADHVVPWTLGGPTIDDNLQTLCGPCNSWKGTRVIDFRKEEPARAGSL